MATLRPPAGRRSALEHPVSPNWDTRRPPCVANFHSSIYNICVIANEYTLVARGPRARALQAKGCRKPETPCSLASLILPFPSNVIKIALAAHNFSRSDLCCQMASHPKTFEALVFILIDKPAQACPRTHPRVSPQRLPYNRNRLLMQPCRPPRTCVPHICTHDDGVSAFHKRNASPLRKILSKMT